MAVQTSARVLARDLPQHLGAVVTLMGWVHRCRHLGKLAFIVIRDRSGLAQAVLEGELAARPLPEESVVAVTGPVALEPRAPGGVEVRVTELRVLAEPTRPLPFELHRKEVRAGLEVVLEHRAFGLRHPKLGAVLRVQAELVHAFREYLRGQGFLEVRTPKIVATGTEGGASLFPVQYFERPAYLAQSPQLYKQMLVGAGYERVFEVGPAYRAEDSHTTRHLAEFTSLDVEVAFVESEEELMDLETELLRHMFRAVAERAGSASPSGGPSPRRSPTASSGSRSGRPGRSSSGGTESSRRRETWTPRGSGSSAGTSPRRARAALSSSPSTPNPAGPSTPARTRSGRGSPGPLTS